MAAVVTNPRHRRQRRHLLRWCRALQTQPHHSNWARSDRLQVGHFLCDLFHPSLTTLHCFRPTSKISAFSSSSFLPSSGYFSLRMCRYSVTLQICILRALCWVLSLGSLRSSHRTAHCLGRNSCSFIFSHLRFDQENIFQFHQRRTKRANLDWFLCPLRMLD